jgi:hypothetical protein
MNWGAAPSFLGAPAGGRNDERTSCPEGNGGKPFEKEAPISRREHLACGVVPQWFLAALVSTVATSPNINSLCEAVAYLVEPGGVEPPTS